MYTHLYVHEVRIYMCKDELHIVQDLTSKLTVCSAAYITNNNQSYTHARCEIPKYEKQWISALSSSRIPFGCLTIK